MKSLKDIYRIGKGPSSSHTMGPHKAAQTYARLHPDAQRFMVTLYGSLAATGKGHMTDVAISEALKPIAPVDIKWEPTVFQPFHPNAMLFQTEKGDDWMVYSVGGGALSEGPEASGGLDADPDIYPLTTLHDIKQYCEDHGWTYWEYMMRYEDPSVWDHLQEVWETMKAAVERGIDREGALPGTLRLQRKAAAYYIKAKGYRPSLQSRALVYAYALAVSEENAAGGTIVTAPTCGSCGVVPAVLYHLQKSHEFSNRKIIHALATAGLIGNIVKENASISGADVGCQGEVGVACAMAAAAATQLFGGSPAQIEYAAEMGLEHHLGMTCDPVGGYVQIPCIERNAFAAARALDANLYASCSDGKHQVTFDRVVEVMKQTGRDLPSLYKETSEGGLAKTTNHGGTRRPYVADFR